MKVGLVGFAGSGKTTIFNTLTGLTAEVGGVGLSELAAQPRRQLDRLVASEDSLIDVVVEDEVARAVAIRVRPGL